MRTATREKSRDEAWIVYVDRDGVRAHQKPDERSKVQKELGYLEGEFFVLEEENDWLLIIQADAVDKRRIRGEYTEIGWVKKKELLLWQHGIINKDSKIHSKVFLLNKASDVENVLSGEKDLVTPYRGPGASAEPLGNLRIYNFFFVLKKERGRFLIAKEVDIPIRGIDRIIVGWVKASRCTEWNTRIVLEPNFSSDAFQERKRNEDLLVKGFSSAEEAQRYIQNSQVGTASSWDRDPAGLPKGSLARDGRRFRGAVLRFPLFSEKRVGEDLFYSGLVGDITVKLRNGQLSVIDPAQWDAVRDRANKWLAQRRKVNVVLAIQATGSMSAQRESILSLADQLQEWYSNVAAEIEFGAICYRSIIDDSAEGGSQLLDIQELSSSHDAFKNFLAQVPLQDFMGNGDDRPAFYYALDEGLKRVGFNSKETNVVIVLGGAPDFSENRLLAGKYKEHPAAQVRPDEIIERLTNNNVHFFALQLQNRGGKAAADFHEEVRFLSEEPAKKAYYEGYGNVESEGKRIAEQNGIEVPPPQFEAVPIRLQEPFRFVLTEGGSYPVGLAFPAEGQQFGDWQAEVEPFVKASADRLGLYQQMVAGLIDGGGAVDESFDNVSAGSFGPVVVGFINEILEGTAIENELLGEKLQLFEEVYFPRQLMGAGHTTMSYVLFMPERDLTNYLNIIQRIDSNIGTSYDSKRESLVAIYKALIQEFTGDRKLSDSQMEQFTPRDVARLIQGLNAEGVSFDYLPNVSLESILDEKSVPDSLIDEQLERFTNIRLDLEEEVFGPDYEFKFQSSDGAANYYWVPIEKVF
ncbi:type VI secretion system protein TssR domain-containing protein [Phaeodactylibacter luteus]|uniref:Type VI secretion system TssR-like N-terminal barrel domain-containing protein n=1 Tax=Phaeodactylibacter luteus TaxID=1564516 RepID=A0A5C6S1K5_9BACT|nr:type VI secretion system protein TssR domain-containing protein [Phaeodactylibacter luteus]TXB68307.1 hypothetical protein FRY97_02705 [Phaeodactylibacter luteus]